MPLVKELIVFNQSQTLDRYKELMASSSTSPALAPNTNEVCCAILSQLWS